MITMQNGNKTDGVWEPLPVIEKQKCSLKLTDPDNMSHDHDHDPHIVRKYFIISRYQGLPGLRPKSAAPEKKENKFYFL